MTNPKPPKPPGLYDALLVVALVLLLIAVALATRIIDL